MSMYSALLMCEMKAAMFICAWVIPSFVAFISEPQTNGALAVRALQRNRACCPLVRPCNMSFFHSVWCGEAWNMNFLHSVWCCLVRPGI